MRTSKIYSWIDFCKLRKHFGSADMKFACRKLVALRYLHVNYARHNSLLYGGRVEFSRIYVFSTAKITFLNIYIVRLWWLKVWIYIFAKWKCRLCYLYTGCFRKVEWRNLAIAICVFIFRGKNIVKPKGTLWDLIWNPIREGSRSSNYKISRFLFASVKEKRGKGFLWEKKSSKHSKSSLLYSTTISTEI